MNRLTKLFSALAPLAFLTLLACGSAQPGAPTINSLGAHPAQWVTDHGVAFLRSPNQCLPCHGSATDPTGTGGTSKVSCFSASFEGQSCHAGGPTAHPDGWSQASQHGLLGAMAAPSTTTGFAYCLSCHTSSTTSNWLDQSCLTCHTEAPHPDAPWRSASVSHVNTAPGNAPQCAPCHTNGANSPLQPTTPAPSGTTPGCFNSTLCHSEAQHPTGWEAAAQHGRLGAMAAPGTSTGFATCNTCHSYDASGTATTSVTCVACHTLAPHPNKPWHGTSTDHTLTDLGNLPECAKCHTDGANSDLKPTQVPTTTTPGCYNSTLCHDAGATAPHVTGTAYLAASAHGPDAKANVETCQPCHATPPSGADPRFNVVRPNMATGCETCHPTYTAHPVPWVPGRGTTQGVTNAATHANAGNLSTACTLCHGSSLTGGTHAPSCMATGLNDGARCHGSNPATTPSGCTSCHGAPPNGSTAPNRAESHVTHVYNNVSCAACHNGRGYGTATHADGTVNVTLGLAYQAKTGGAATFNSTSLTCANVSCHGGQTTPAWNTTGQIDVTTQCTKCHRPTSSSDQYNSQHSGDHSDHSGGSFSCTECHAMGGTSTGAQNHFKNLGTSAMEGPAGSTIANGSTGFAYNVTTKSCGTFTCHGETHNGRTW